MADGKILCNSPVWPSNTGNELLYDMQILFSQDNHNHDQVLHEETFNLPLLLPENQVRPPFQFCNATSGRVERAPFSRDNIMHTHWQQSRLATNINTPFGSDSNIYFDKVLPAGLNDKWLDWLDVNARTASNETMGDRANESMDEKVANCCAGKDGYVCSQTCVDWWTNRPTPPQGSMMPRDGAVGGGCPFNTMPALSCYPCSVHNLYQRGAK